MKQRRGIRSIIIRAGIFLLLGALVNIAVAWTIAYRAESEPLGVSISTAWSGSQKGHHGHLLTPYRYFHPHGAFVSVLYRNRAQTAESIEAYIAKHKGSSQFDADLIMPYWSYARRSQLGFDDPEISNLREDAAGWPCIALSSMLVQSEFMNWKWVVRRGIALNPLVGRGGWSQPRALPLHPIWPGFAINTLFYAAILWLLLALPLALRRWRRIKRGLCPACAYPVGASDLCTECGKAIPASLITRARSAPSS